VFSKRWKTHWTFTEVPDVPGLYLLVTPLSSKKTEERMLVELGR